MVERMTPTDDDIRMALEFVIRAPISKAQFAKQAHIGKTKSARLLEILHARGLVDVALDGQFGWRYATPDAAERIREQARIRRAMKKARVAENGRKWEERRKALSEDDSVDSWPILRSIVPAHETKITKRGPASVWELAA